MFIGWAMRCARQNLKREGPLWFVSPGRGAFVVAYHQGEVWCVSWHHAPILTAAKILPELIFLSKRWTMWITAPVILISLFWKNI